MAAENSWFNFPLLVHIQSVKSKELHTSTSFVSGSSLSSSNNEQVNELTRKADSGFYILTKLDIFFRTKIIAFFFR